jgi:small-conductance mechanosensitive channel
MDTNNSPDASGRYAAMPARAFVFALLLLLCATAAGWSAEPAGAPVVLQLQLPPSMSPDAVRELIADLTAKGARPAAEPADPLASSNSTSLAARVWGASKQALRALPALRRAPQVWIELIEAEGGTHSVALRFSMIALAGLLAGPLIGWGVRGLLDRWQSGVTESALAPGSRAMIIRFLADVAAQAVFGVLLWAVLLGISSGLPILEETADRLVWAVMIWRLSIVVLMFVVSPQRPDLRLMAIDDADARVCVRWLTVYLMVNPFYPFLVGLVERMGLGQEAVFSAALPIGLAVTSYKIAMCFGMRGPIRRAILAATGTEPGPFRRAVAALWHWLFTALALGIFSALIIELSLGKGALVAGGAAATQVAVIVLVVLWQVSHNLIARLFVGEETDIQLTLRRARFRRALRRLADAFLLILGAAWLGEGWGLNIVDPAPGSFEGVFLRPACGAAATVVAAWILWTALSVVIDEKMPRAVAPGGENEVIHGSASRLGTLLPLVRHIVFIGLAVVAVIVALSMLGVNIGPLLAGLGVVGIAIGFGAQNLVRDIISGIFFLMEDAFRVGEYIQSGNYKGTVESFSFRSVRLRHQRGALYTVPFGLLGAVQNQSRDWTIDKLTVGITYDSDIDRARKLIKQIGLDLAKDPEFAPLILQPLKMQGVDALGDFAVQIRMKMMTLPGENFVIRRQALAMIKKTFDANGIKFAFPTVQIAGDGDPATAAVAQQALQLTHPAVAAAE